MFFHRQELQFTATPDKPDAIFARRMQEVHFSDGQAAAEGSWASGPTPDGKGEFTYLDGPDTSVPMPPPTQPDPRFYGTDAKPNLIDKAEGVIKDKLS